MTRKNVKCPCWTVETKNQKKKFIYFRSIIQPINVINPKLIQILILKFLMLIQKLIFRDK